MTIAEQHHFICHSDGSVCEDGCDITPIPGKLEELDILMGCNQPPAGSWADVARMMASDDDSGFDWDAWKDQMKEDNA